MRELCLPFYALFCLFFLFSQLHSPLCAFAARTHSRSAKQVNFLCTRLFVALKKEKTF